MKFRFGKKHKDRGGDQPERKHRKKMQTLKCNLCKTTFLASSRFLRFCPSCRSQSELFRFAEWLPAH